MVRPLVISIADPMFKLLVILFVNFIFLTKPLFPYDQKIKTKI